MSSNILGSITTISDLGTVPEGLDLSDAIIPVESGRKTFKMTMAELAAEIGGSGGDPNNVTLFSLSVVNGHSMEVGQAVSAYGATQNFDQHGEVTGEIVDLTASNTSFDPEGIVELGDPVPEPGTGIFLDGVAEGTTVMTVVHEHEGVTYTQLRNITITPVP